MFIPAKPGKVICLRDFSSLFRKAYEASITFTNAANGFECTGIYPYNPNVFTDEDFAPAEVTESNELIYTLILKIIST